MREEAAERPRSRHASILDVAALAGVSAATVSRSLRGRGSVSPTTRQRVLDAARELSYSASPHASGLASGRTTTVGIVAPFIGRWYFANAVAGAAVLFLLYLPFRSAGMLPLGAVPNVVAFIRFNGPLFKGLAWLLTPQGAAAVALARTAPREFMAVSRARVAGPTGEPGSLPICSRWAPRAAADAVHLPTGRERLHA